MGNVDLPEEIEPARAARRRGRGTAADRVPASPAGATLPTEDEQADYFRRVARGVSRRSRWWSAPSTSAATSFPRRSRRRPRRIRSSAGARSGSASTSPEIFRPQLRAVLRAAVDRDLRLMLPLITRGGRGEQARGMVLEEEPARFRRAGDPRRRRRCRSASWSRPRPRWSSADRLAEVSDVLQRRDQRPDPVHPGGRPGQRPAGRPVHAAPSGDRAAAAHGGRGRAARPASRSASAARWPPSRSRAVLLMGLGYERAERLAASDLPLVKWVVRTVPLSAARRGGRPAALEARDARPRYCEALRAWSAAVHRRAAARPDSRACSGRESCRGTSRPAGSLRLDRNAAGCSVRSGLLA